MRAKDSHPGIVPPPKGMGGVFKHENFDAWIQAILKEIDDITEMGSVTHLHTWQDLKDAGVDVDKIPPYFSHMVFENKLKRDEASQTVELDKAKARMVIDGRKKFFVKGIHYEDGYSPTPKHETCRMVCAIRILLGLKGKSFDVSNAYCQATRATPIALEYPRGMEQYNDKGEKLFQILWRNHYGTPDGSPNWDVEKDEKYEARFSRPEEGWSMHKCVLDPCLYRIDYTPLINGSDCVPGSDSLRGDLSMKNFCLMLIHSDDHDMVSASVTLMDIIRDFAHSTWGVKDTSGLDMLGVKRRIFEQEGVTKMELTMQTQVEGSTRAFNKWMLLAGYDGKKQANTPFPTGKFLSLFDPMQLISSKEANEVKARGFNILVGLLVWASLMCFPELKYGTSMLSRVLSHPTFEAWECAMHMLQWLHQERERGIMFRSDGNLQPFAECDASNKQDCKDGLVMYGYSVVMANAPVITQSTKLKNIGFGTPATEFMAMANAVDKGTVDAKLDELGHSRIDETQLEEARGMATRWTGASVVWLRNLLHEIGMHDMIRAPTKVFSDSSGAIDWMRHKKITPGNNYILLAYHQTGEFMSSGFIDPTWRRGKYNCSDLLTKASTPQDMARLLRKFLGYDIVIPEEVEEAKGKSEKTS